MTKPKRKCGNCNICCIVPEIQEPFVKEAGEACRHLKGTSTSGQCSIYTERPPVCRNFKCLWLQGELSESDRPNKSGILAWALHDNVIYITESFPGAFQTPKGRKARWSIDFLINEIRAARPDRTIHTVEAKFGEVVLVPNKPKDGEKMICTRRGRLNVLNDETL